MAKIKEIFSLVKGTLQSSKCTPGDYNFITASKDWKTHNEFSNDHEALIFAAAASGSLGRTHYVNGKFITSDLCFIITPKDNNKFPIDLKFYHIIFQTLKDDIVKNTKAGTSKEAIGLKSLGEYDIPYISIEKQREISAKFLSLTDISENFTDESKNQLSLISQLRQAFLKEAMQGKLVSNETSDGKTGAQLLAEIRTEKGKLIQEKKIKKGKPLPLISEEEIPFEIPENWAWCRLGDISDLITKGSSPKWQGVKYVDSYEEGILFVTSKNVNHYKIDLTKATFVTESFNKVEPRSILQKGDLLTNIVGGSIGRTAIYDLDYNANINQAVCLIRLNEILQKLFILKLFNSDYIISEMFAYQFSPGRANLSLSNLENFKIPLPPLEIQNRLVSILEELMNYCVDLETAVKESQNYNEQLLQQVLREALEVKKVEKQEVLGMVAEEKAVYSISKKVLKNYDIGDLAILAGYIISKLSTQNSKDFGRVKLQKMLHLAEYHCQLSTNLQYQKKVAGPYTSELEYAIEPKLKSFRFFDIKKEKFSASSKVTYTPLSASAEIPSLFEREFKNDVEKINQLLEKFRNKNWEFCEMISTMYAVWNNRLIKKEVFSDDILKQDFLQWDTGKIRFIDQLNYAIDWIRKEKIEPTGFGRYIDKE